MSTFDELMNTVASQSQYSSEPGAVNKYANYQYAADSHNYGNGNWAVTDPTTWGTAVGNGAKMVVAGLASGINSFYNTGVAVGNWLGADLKENDVHTQLAALDSDLGAYYQQNRESADLAGFVMTSIIPGIGGVKLLNAGQKALKGASAGMVGKNLSRATGLLTPSVDAYRSLAAAEIASSAATFSLTKGNTLKALGAGYGQAALESAAFEIAVVATMFKSPMLEDQDGWDIAKNMAMGTAVGGVIGGAFTHASTLGAIKKKVLSLNSSEKTFTNTAYLEGLSEAERITVRQTQLASMPAAPTANEIMDGTFTGANELLKNVPMGDVPSVANQLSSKFARTRATTANDLTNANRSGFQVLANKDAELANSLSDLHQSMSPDQSFAAMTHVEGFGRVSTTLKQELELVKHQKEVAKAADDWIKKGMEGELPVAAPVPYKIGYVKISGEGTGNVSFEPPAVLSIADIMPDKASVMKLVDKAAPTPNQIFDVTEHLGNHHAVELRYLAADKAPIMEGMKVGEFDIPMLERIAFGADTNISVNVIGRDGASIPMTGADVVKHLQLAKQQVNETLTLKAALNNGLDDAGNKISNEMIAKMSNTRTSLVDGESNVLYPEKDLFARQADKRDYAKYLEDNDIYDAQKKLAEYGTTPTYAKAAYNTKTQMADGMELAGMAYMKAQQKAYQQGIDNVFAKAVGDDALASQFVHPSDEMLLNTNRYGSGPGLVSFANGGYGTPESWAEFTGAATSRLQAKFKNATTEKLQSSLLKLRTNQEAAIEFEVINKEIMSSPEHYGINPEGTGIEPLKLLDYKAKIAAGKKATAPELADGTKTFIPIKTPEAFDAWRLRTEMTGEKTNGYIELFAAQGKENAKDIRALRPIRQDPLEYPHYAIVSDPSINNTMHKSMIHANSAAELDAMIARVPKEFQVTKGNDAKEFFKSQGTYEFDLTLHENYIDSKLKRSGVNNPYFVRTDPQLIAESILKDHLRADDVFARELVSAKYEKEFSFLRQQGEQYTSSEASRYTGSFRSIENSIKNPYTNYSKTALNISQMNEHPLIQGVNQKLDEVVTKGWRAIDSLWDFARKPQDLGAINDALKKFGVQSAYNDAAGVLLANHTAPRGALNTFVGQANSIVSTLVTRLDPLNAINNAVGANVLYGTETNSFLKAMKSSDPDNILAGKLSGILKTPAPLLENTTPEGIAAMAQAGKSGDQMTTQGKLMMNAIKNFVDKDAKNSAGQFLHNRIVDGVEVKGWYAQSGWNTRLNDQFHSMMENLTLVGNETEAILSSKMQSAFTAAKNFAEKGEKLTGNRLSEEFNRFIAADTMRQMTDIGVQAGKLTNKEQFAYINTFVNRTQGNILASQRPLMFQGPIGQAVGLFQSFQFNTMQQMFRHVAEGSGKDAAMMLGLQGTMYGMNGLPAFNFINTHIVGTMSGNPQHKDMYDATYGIAGKNIGDLLLYGLPSNLLQANLYTRGDINPRSLTIIPTNPADIPFVSAITKTYTNAKNTVSTMANGGSIWQGMLQGIEHNGLSRPLAGIAQVAQSITHEGNVFSTTKKGNIAGANDLMSWGTAVRLAGGKPLDEGIVNDATFRITAYAAKDRLKMDALNKAIKSRVIAGGELEAEDMATFAEQYAALGGKQKNFNKYIMLQIKTANTSKANAITDSLTNPYARKMQQIMGGEQYEDGNDM